MAKLTTEKEARTGNRRLAQWRVKWLIEHSTSHQLLWCIDSFVLRNPPLRQAPTVSSKASGTHHQNRTKSNQKLPLEILSADGNGWRTKQQKIVI